MFDFTYRRTLLLYVVAGLAEIGGGWLVWQWLRDGRGLPLGLLGGAVCSRMRPCAIIDKDTPAFYSLLISPNRYRHGPGPPIT
jgi:drug/metabolite transporter superfamily protein YnfA